MSKQLKACWLAVNNRISARVGLFQRVLYALCGNTQSEQLDAYGYREMV